MSEELARLRARREKLANEIESMQRDAEAWNRLHPDEEPIDVNDLIAAPRALLAKIDRQLGVTN